MSRYRQRGVALLVAIVIFAIATTVAAAVTYNKTMAARRAAASFTVEQALQAGMAAEALASIALEDGAKNQTTHLAQDWAQALDPLEIPDTGIWIQSRVEDMQGRFNLNSVIEENPQTHQWQIRQHQYEIFLNLLRDLDIDIRYADMLVDWIDPDNQPTGTGCEDTCYLSQNPPYRPPNTFITHTSELLALPGFGAENYRKIAPFVTALPQAAKFNQCTASKLMLDEALNDPTNQSQYRNMSDDDLAEQRAKGCWPPKAVYTSVLTGTKKTDVENAVDEKSDWFRVRTNVRIGTTEFVLYSLLYREPGQNKLRPVQRSFGSE
ncbi:MAG TPA: type II secretion system minor pseudopilin GspK [Steroidobacteraceae bacterium]|jgi:general secretion pathway protein K|nr:type II secretion system minor pseudopilin GspK [Steroidobacteraceae bacterium]